MSGEVIEVRQGNDVAHMMRQATDVAGVCKEIVVRTAQKIQGRQYVRVEGWQAIATAHGCMASAENVRLVEGGIAATGVIRRVDTGAVICTAEGFVGDDEPTWAKRPLYARRAMCQTRAISRVCRSAFAHVIVLMQAGLETTPAEEVDAGWEPDPGRKIAKARQALAEAERVAKDAPAVKPPEAPAKVARGTVTDKQLEALKDLCTRAHYTRLMLRGEYGVNDAAELSEELAADLTRALERALESQEPAGASA